MDWDYPSPFTQDLHVRPEDIDGLGHTNNACYVIWCETCAWKHSESLGLTVADYRRLDRGVAISAADYQYFQPSFVDERLVIGTWITHCDRKLRLQRRFQVLNAESGATVMRGHWLLIGVTLSSGRATRFPQEFTEIYGGASLDVEPVSPSQTV